MKYIFLLFIFISFLKGENHSVFYKGENHSVFYKGENHSVFYKGIEIGNIENLNEQLLTNTYIKGKIKDTYLKYLLLSDYFILYKDIKPDFSDTFYKKNEKILTLLQMFLHNPSGDYIFEDKQLISTCFNQICNYKYYSKGLLKSEGNVILNGNKIVAVYDETNNALITSIYNN